MKKCNWGGVQRERRFFLPLFSAYFAAILIFATIAVGDNQAYANIDNSQVDSRFPDASGESRQMVINRRQFKGYAKQGNLRILNHGIKAAELYINGKLLVVNWNIIGMQNVDISGLTHDGSNELKLLAIQKDSDDGYCDIAIDFPVLEKADPTGVGFAVDKLTLVDKLIEQDIANGLSGAALLIIKDGKIVKSNVYGYAKKYEQLQLLPTDKWQPLAQDTMFDLASNSKMYATVFALQHLVAAGKINVDDKVAKYIPEFDKENYRDISLRNLLLHNAGFAPEVQYFKPEVANKSGQYSMNREQTLAKLSLTPLVRPINQQSVYSDTDFIILGYIIELVGGMRLDRYVAEHIYKPLGLARTTYLPLTNGFSQSDIAATERCGNTRDFNVYFPGVRDYVLQGEVHDEKCWYSLGGVAGHAGLFSNLADLAVLLQTMLNHGGYGRVKLWDKFTQEQFTKISDNDIGEGLGWNKNRIWLFGPYASMSTVGHSGWTGTATLIDFDNDMAVVLLTNRVHSPVVDPPNGFATAKLETNRYGSIMALVYEAFLEKN